jgi:hypothetical protein
MSTGAVSWLKRAAIATIVGILVAATSARAQDPVPTATPVASMSQLMVDFIYPASDAVFYIESRTPQSGEEWNELVGWTLMLAESANLLMAPSRALDQDQWLRDAELMRAAGAAAYEAATNRDVAALVELSDGLYESCTTCHQHYRPEYRGSR